MSLFGVSTSTRDLATSANKSDAFISGDTVLTTGDIYTIQAITVTITENYNLTSVDNNHDIYQISYSFDISPSLLLPDSSTISNGSITRLSKPIFFKVTLIVSEVLTAPSPKLRL